MLPDSQRLRNWHSAWSGLETPLGEGDHGEWGPTLPGHSQPPAQKGKQLLWSHLPTCGPTLSPNKNTRNTNGPGERVEGRSREEFPAEPAPEHKTAIQANTKVPCLDPEAPESSWGEEGFQGPPVSVGVGRAWSAQADSPLERWIQVCWLSLRKKPLWH